MSSRKLSEQWYAEADKFTDLSGKASNEKEAAFFSGISTTLIGCAFEIEWLEDLLKEAAERLAIAEKAVSILADCGGMLNCGKHCPVAGECEPVNYPRLKPGACH